jgi:hypothetical protein
MHKILVTPLPLRCRLTAIFDVSQFPLTYEHTDRLPARRLVILRPSLVRWCPMHVTNLTISN